MFRLFRHIRAAFNYAGHLPWTDQPLWDATDAKALATFLGSPTGRRMKALYVNAVLRQQANALQRTGPSRLVYEAGYSAGQKGFLAFTESLADGSSFTDRGGQDADPDTNQPVS